MGLLLYYLVDLDVVISSYSQNLMGAFNPQHIGLNVPFFSGQIKKKKGNMYREGKTGITDGNSSARMVSRFENMNEKYNIQRPNFTQR